MQHISSFRLQHFSSLALSLAAIFCFAVMTPAQMPIQVTAPVMNVAAGSNFEAPVTVTDTTGFEIIAIQFDLYYDQAVITPQTPPITGTGTISEGWACFYNTNTPGLLKVACFSSSGLPLAGAGTLFKLRFTAIGSDGNTSQLHWNTNPNPPNLVFTFNGQTTTPAPTDGSITIGVVPTNTATNTPTSTATFTPTFTPSASPTESPTNTATSTPSNTATDTPTATETVTPTFTATPANTPTVTTDPATSITSTSAQLNGSANPNGEAAFGHFRYSLANPGDCDDVFGTRLPTSSGSDVSLGAGSSPIPFSFMATGLTAGATYYYCAIANNTVGGVSYGSVLSFTMIQTVPTVITYPAAFVTDTQAQFNGTANPHAAGALGWFRYSTSDPGTCNDSFGTRAPLSGAAFLGGGTSPVAYSYEIDGLTPGTTYYYCAISLNNIGFGFGQIFSFTTPGAPATTTLAATNVMNEASQLNGSANPNGLLTSGWFRYSTTDPVTCDDTFGTRAPLSGGTSLGSGTSVQPYAQTVTGLSPETTYYFCAIASNFEGMTFGAVLSFTTTNITPSPTPTDTPTPTATETFTPTPTITATDTPTATETLTPTETATETFTPTPTTESISGSITYGNALGNPVPPRFVQNVSVASTAGAPPVGPVVTGASGTYLLTGFGAGSYTIKPSKPGSSNTSITSNDAARVAQGVSNLVPFASLNQKFASDVSGNGTVSSNDAALIARFAAGLTGTGNAGQWKFFTADLPGLPTGPLPTPPYNDSRTYASVTSNVASEDFVAILVGEASGNWNPATHPRTVNSGQWTVNSEEGSIAEKPITVTAEHVITPVNMEIVIPVSVQGAADKAIISYEFNLRYDPLVIQPLEHPAVLTGTVSRGLMVVANPYKPGLLRVVVYGPMPIDQNGVLLNLRFTAVGGAGSVSLLTFERMMFNEGEPHVSVADGRVELF